jgi:hypothetical protein
LTVSQERRPTQITDRQNATMMLVGDVADRVAILVDDLADTSNTITRAAKLLKKEGANKVIALVTHGVLSGVAIDRINASAIDKVVVTNSVDQEENKKRCQKLEVLEVGNVFAEVSWVAPSRVVIRDVSRRGQTIDNHYRPSGESTTERVSACCSTTRWLLRMLNDLAGVRGMPGWHNSIEGVLREEIAAIYEQRAIATWLPVPLRLGLRLPDANQPYHDVDGCPFSIDLQRQVLVFFLKQKLSVSLHAVASCCKCDSAILCCRPRVHVHPLFVYKTYPTAPSPRIMLSM